MPSSPATRIAEPLLGGPVGIHLAAAGATIRRRQAFVFLGLLGLTTFLALTLQGPCLASGYAQPSASARMCAGPLSTAFLGRFNPDAPGRADGGMADLSPLGARFVELMRAMTDDVSVFMAFVLLLNVAGIAAIGIALLVLARRRAWLLGLFLSPVILFTLGSSLDPLGLALALWALVVFLGTPPLPPRPWLAGVLLAIAAFINPLALLVLLALAVAGRHPAGSTAPRSPQMMLAAAAIASAFLLVIDGTAIDRIVHWTGDATDGGSFASILAMTRLADSEAWAPAWIIAATGIVLAVAIALLLVRRRGIDPAVASCILIGAWLLLAPAAMPWDTLWLLPFLVLSVSRWWLLILWSLAEATFAIGSHLGDVGAIDSAKGLEPSYVAVFTLLRLFILVVIVILAGENLHRRRTRTLLRSGPGPDHPPRRDADAAGPVSPDGGPGESPRRDEATGQRPRIRAAETGSEGGQGHAEAT